MTCNATKVGVQRLEVAVKYAYDRADGTLSMPVQQTLVVETRVNR